MDPVIWIWFFQTISFAQDFTQTLKDIYSMDNWRYIYEKETIPSARINSNFVGHRLSDTEQLCKRQWYVQDRVLKSCSSLPYCKWNKTGPCRIRKHGFSSFVCHLSLLFIFLSWLDIDELTLSNLRFAFHCEYCDDLVLILGVFLGFVFFLCQRNLTHY